MKHGKTWTSLMVAGLALACQDQPLTAPLAGPDFAISDAQHGAGNPHFFFLPPIGPRRGFTGTFDGTLSPVVEICEWSGTACAGQPVSRLTMTDPSAIDRVYVLPALEEYGVLWRTAQLHLNDQKTYRIRVLVAGQELGFADVNVVKTLRDLLRNDSDEYVGLLKDFILPIQFRIERGAVFLIGPDGGTFGTTDGNAQVVVPAGMFPEQKGFSVQPANVPADQFAPAGLVSGTAYEFGPSGTVFPAPGVTVTLRYDPANLNGLSETSLTLLTQIDGKWAQVPNPAVDPVAHTVTANVGHFSTIVVGVSRLATINQRYLTLLKGGSPVTLTFTIGQNSSFVGWSSSTPAIATVTNSTDGQNNGIVTPVDTGAARIRVTSYDPYYGGWTDEIFVTVLATAPPADQFAWYKQREGITAAHLYGIGGVSATDFFLVGRGGTILHANGTTATPMPSSTTRTLFGVWARNATDAYVVGVGAPGTGSSVQRYNGVSWNHIFVDPAVTVYGVSGNSEFAFVAAGDRMLRFKNASDATNNQLYTYTFPSGTKIRAVAAEENDTVIAVGENVPTGEGMIFRSIDKGVTWDAGQVPQDYFGRPRSGPITSIWRDPSNKVAAAGTLDGRSIMTGNDGDTWLINEQVTSIAFRAVTSRPKGASLVNPDVFLGADNGKLLWAERCRCGFGAYGFNADQSANQDITGMWTDPNGIAWGVGLAGFIFRQNSSTGHNFTVMSQGQPFADVWVDPSGRVVVASATFKNEVFMTSSFGTSWYGVPLNTGGTGWQGAFGAPDGSEAYLVGLNGAIARGTPSSNGYAFANLVSGTTANLDDAWVGPGTGHPVYVVGASATVLRSADHGATWVSRGSPQFGTREIVQVYGLGDNDVFVAAEDGSVYRTTDGGLTWGLFRTGLGELPTGLLAVSPGEIYLGTTQGGVGKIVHWYNAAGTPPAPGAVWQADVINGTRFMSGVWRSPTGTVFVAGSNGTVVLSNDHGTTPWVPQSTGTTSDLYAVSGAGNVVFATGAAGTIVTGVHP